MFANSQLQIFLLAFYIGLALAVVYDMIKIFRYAIPHTNLFVYIEDALFWIISTFSTFHICLEKNDGEIRVYFLIAIFLGMLLYFMLISSFVMSLSEKIIDICKFIINLFIEIISTPFKLLYIFFGRPIVKITKKYIKILVKCLHSYKFCVKIKLLDFLRDKKIINNLRDMKKVNKKINLDFYKKFNTMFKKNSDK